VSCSRETEIKINKKKDYEVRPSQRRPDNPQIKLQERLHGAHVGLASSFSLSPCGEEGKKEREKERERDPSSWRKKKR
jgi:hypothetical protein